MMRGSTGIGIDQSGVRRGVLAGRRAWALAVLLPAMVLPGCRQPPEAPDPPRVAMMTTVAARALQAMVEPAGAAEPEEPAEAPVPVNEVRIEETDRVRLEYTGAWFPAGTADWSGGSAVVASAGEASVTFRFTGTRVSWISARGASSGIANVSIDGTLIGRANLYSDVTVAPERVFTSKVLKPGPHTLTIEATGRADSSASGTRVTVDAFDVTGGAPHTTAYTITDLGTLGGEASSAADINNRGEVVGWSTTADGERRAFVYRGADMIDLGTLTGGSYSEATAINDSGQVAGFGGINAYGPNFREYMMGFLWADGALHNLPGLHCHCDFNKRYPVSIAYDVNNAANAVGWSPGPRGESIPYATLWRIAPEDDYIGWSGEPLRPPDVDPGQWEISRAFAINDYGEVAGDYAPDAGREGIDERLPFVFLHGRQLRLALERLPGHAAGTPLDIDWAGRAAGWSGSVNAATSRAVLWRQGVARDLGTLPGDSNSQALGINASGDVVGWSGSSVEIEIARADRRRETMNPGHSHVSDPSVARAFLWRNGEMVDLNGVTGCGENGAGAVAGWEFVEAAAINDAGQIAGTGFLEGRMRAFLLTPCD